MTTTRKVNWLGAFKDFGTIPITPSRCSSAPPTAFWISTTSVSRFLPAYLGAVTPEALCYTDALTDLWPSLKPVFSSVVFIQIQDEPNSLSRGCKAGVCTARRYLSPRRQQWAP